MDRLGLVRWIAITQLTWKASPKIVANIEQVLSTKWCFSIVWLRILYSTTNYNNEP
jgi:hypothetical protein